MVGHIVRIFCFLAILFSLSFAPEAISREILFNEAEGGNGDGRNRSIVVLGPDKLQVGQRSTFEIFLGEYVRGDGSVNPDRPILKQPIQAVSVFLAVPEDKVRIHYPDIKIDLLSSSGSSDFSRTGTPTLSSFDSFLEPFTISDSDIAKDYVEAIFSVGGILLAPSQFSTPLGIAGVIGNRLMEDVFGTDDRAINRLQAIDPNEYDLVKAVWANSSTLQLSIINSVKLTIPFTLEEELADSDRISMYAKLHNAFNTITRIFTAGTHYPDLNVFGELFPRPPSDKDVVASNGGPFSRIEDPPLAIRDNDPSGITSTLSIAESFIITSTTAEVDITHSYRGDLKIDLTSPSGSRTTLFNQTGGDADNLNSSFRKTIFNGENAIGDWTLNVADLAGQDIGALNSWTLSFSIESEDRNLIQGILTGTDQTFQSRHYDFYVMDFPLGTYRIEVHSSGNNIGLYGVRREQATGQNEWITQTDMRSKNTEFSVLIPGEHVFFIIADGSNVEGSYTLTLSSLTGTLPTFASKTVVQSMFRTIDSSTPSSTELMQNFPNPFNKETSIPFTIGASYTGENVELNIYNSLGQKVKILVDGPLASGMYTLSWDGVNYNGNEVASGSYIYRLQVGDITEQQFMSYVK